MTAGVGLLEALNVLAPYLGDARLEARLRRRFMTRPLPLSPEPEADTRPKTERVLEALMAGPKTAAEVATLTGQDVVDVRRCLNDMTGRRGPQRVEVCDVQVHRRPKGMEELVWRLAS